MNLSLVLPGLDEQGEAQYEEVAEVLDYRVVEVQNNQLLHVAKVRTINNSIKLFRLDWMVCA